MARTVSRRLVAEIVKALSLLPTVSIRTMTDEGAEGRRFAEVPRMSGSVRRFARHYVEMVVAMLVGMAVLGGASSLVLDLPDRTWVELVEMAVWMTLPMVAWMRFRGHGWRACNEMAAAMLVPAGAALLLLWSGVVTDGDALVMFEHTAMFPAMLVVMLLRRDEYAGHDHAEAAAPSPG